MFVLKMLEVAVDFIGLLKEFITLDKITSKEGFRNLEDEVKRYTLNSFQTMSRLIFEKYLNELSSLKSSVMGGALRHVSFSSVLSSWDNMFNLKYAVSSLAIEVIWRAR